MSEDVVSWCDVGWDHGHPGVVVGDQVIRSPCTWNTRPNFETSFANLEELESGLVNGGAVVAIAGSEVVDDWSLVGLWPRSPLQLDLGSSSDWNGFTEWVRSSLVADDAWVAKCGWSDEAVVEVAWNAPAGDLWLWVGKLEGRGVSREA